MEEISLKMEGHKRGIFLAKDGIEELGEMIFEIEGTALTVYHTEVEQKANGTGLAKRILEKMVAFARDKSLMVIPMCPFVHIQFERHPELYKDIWKDHESTKS